MQKSKSWLSSTSSKLTERCHLFCLLSVLWHIICYKAFICTSLHFSCCWRFFFFYLFIYLFSNRAFLSRDPLKPLRERLAPHSDFTLPLNVASSLNERAIVYKKTLLVSWTFCTHMLFHLKQPERAASTFFRSSFMAFPINFFPELA